MSCSLKAVAQDILLSGEAYRNFVCSARSEATKNAYTKALRLYMKFKGLTDCEQLLTSELKLIQSNIIEWLIHLKEVQNLHTLLFRCIAQPYTIFTPFYSVIFIHRI